MQASRRRAQSSYRKRWVAAPMPAGGWRSGRPRVLCAAWFASRLQRVARAFSSDTAIVASLTGVMGCVALLIADGGQGATVRFAGAGNC
jgi:hypothetical protein